MHWRLNRIQYPVYNLGPGKRIGVWAQGCSLRCKGCVSRTLWDPNGGKDVDVESLAKFISRSNTLVRLVDTKSKSNIKRGLNIQSGANTLVRHSPSSHSSKEEKLLKPISDSTDGITITGGEPFEQYEALIAFCAYIKRLTGWSIYVFTGYTLQELTARRPDRLFLQFIDYLMDGRYEESRHEDRNVRGSSNQRLYKFVDQTPLEMEMTDNLAGWSVNVDEEGTVFMSGIPKENDLDSMAHFLKKSGVNIRFK